MTQDKPSRCERQRSALTFTLMFREHDAQDERVIKSVEFVVLIRFAGIANDDVPLYVSSMMTSKR